MSFIPAICLCFVGLLLACIAYALGLSDGEREGRERQRQEQRRKESSK